MMQVDITLQPYPDEGEEDVLGMRSDSINKIRGAVRCTHFDGRVSEIVFEEWGKTPWIEWLDQRFTEVEEDEEGFNVKDLKKLYGC